MILLRTHLFLLVVALVRGGKLDFPGYFMFGAATSSYQIEGAWNVSDKSENIWDRFTHEHPSRISDGSTGDVACDSYHLWKRDVEMCSELGLDFYRFSLSWSRLLPNGFSNKVSAAGVRYYDDLIDALLREGIRPMVTLYHWDLPQNLQDLGGWTNPLIAEWFTDFARVAFRHFGDRVPYWITINEPAIICDHVYNTGVAPGIVDYNAPYICTKNVLLAHAKAWRLYNKQFKPKYHGKVSIANHLLWYEPATPADQEITDLTFEFGLGRFMHPIYTVQGGWPAALEKFMEDKSMAEGYPRSKLPKMTFEEIQLIKGTYDYLGFNHYTSRLVSAGEGAGRWPFEGAPEVGGVYSVRPDWQPTVSSWYYYYPESIRLLLRWLRNQYGAQEFLITENGMSTSSGLDDSEREAYYREQLTQVLLAIKEDGVNVTGYTAWSLMDNFEWDSGFTSKFGLYEVDFEDPQRKRTPRMSALTYQGIIRNRALDQLYLPERNITHPK